MQELTHERYANFTVSERRDYRESQKDFWDLYAVTETAEKKGRAEGRAEGLVEGRAEGLVEGEAIGRTEEKYAMATNLKKLGIPFDTISEASGLTIEEIEKL